jgi:hypothetical protein
VGDVVGPLLWVAVVVYWTWLRRRPRPAWATGRLVTLLELGVSLAVLYLGAVLASGMINRR